MSHEPTVVPVPGEGAEDVVLDGLRFANGVALSADESFVAVAGTGGRSVVRRWLSGPHEGRSEPLVTDLPGHPDNISRGSDGLIWVTVPSPTDDGTVVHDLSADATGYHLATGVREHRGRVWLGSLHRPAVAVLDPV